MTITAESKFVELVRSWLVSLPHDLKIAFDAMDDENLPRSVRETASGVAIYVVSPNDSVSADKNDVILSYADDAWALASESVYPSAGEACDERSKLLKARARF